MRTKFRQLGKLEPVEQEMIKLAKKFYKKNGVYPTVSQLRIIIGKKHFGYEGEKLDQFMFETRAYYSMHIKLMSKWGHIRTEKGNNSALFVVLK